MAKKQEIVLRNGEVIHLNDRELMFCNYYLGECGKNATQAAIKAGYSAKTAAVISTENLIKPNIQAYIRDKTAPLMEALGITQERILRERAAMAFTNLTDLVDDDWRLKKKSEIDPKFYPALNQVKISEKVLVQEGNQMVLSREISYKIADKDKSLAVLEKMAGMVKDPEPPAPVQQVTMYNQLNNYIGEK